MYPTEYKIENIERVIDEALILSKEIGIEKLSKARLAKQVRISTKTMDRYFKTKTELIYRMSEKLLNNWYSNIEKEYHTSIPDDAKGTDMFLCFMKIHNEYILNDYKGLLLIQQADLHCRYFEEDHNMYWSRFRKTDKLENFIRKTMVQGIEDGSMDPNETEKLTPKMLTTLCAGLVEHLASYIHSNAMTIEEAINVSNRWIMESTNILSK